MSQRRILVLDTETTTNKNNVTSICDVAWLELNEQAEVIDEVSSLIDPLEPISASSSGCHGIVDADVQDAPTIEELFEIVLPAENHVVPYENVVIIAHNVSYDRPLMEPHMGIVDELCTMRAAMKYLRDAEDFKQQTLRYQYGLKAGTAHRAAGDIVLTYNLLKFLMDVSGLSLTELVQDLTAPVWVSTMPFGKHRGEPIEKVPAGWIRWALTNIGDMTKDLRWTLEQVLENKVKSVTYGGANGLPKT